MARPQRNIVDYFPHIIGGGKKMYFIENKYGNDGYATWYKILEKLASTHNHFLDLNKPEEIMYLSSKCKVTDETLILIINDLVKLTVFHKEMWENKIIWCPVFIENIQDAYLRRKNKCIDLEGLRIHLSDSGIHFKSLCIQNPPLLSSKTDINTQSIVEYSILNETKVKNTDTEIIFYRKFAHLKITFEEVEKLKKLGFTQTQIDGILGRIENYKKNTNYKSLFLTAKNWLEDQKEKSSVKKENYLDPEKKYNASEF